MRARLLARSVVLMMGAGLIAVPAIGGAPSAGANPTESIMTSVTSSPPDGRRATDIRNYWTSERMARSRPMSESSWQGSWLLPPGQVEVSGAPGPLLAATAPRVGNIVVPRTVGKLFVRSPWGDQHCTAAIVRSKRKNQIITAGHCVNAGAQGGWYSDWLFVPQYDRGRAPHGRWVGFQAYAPAAWTKHGNYSRDYAIIKVRKLNGRHIQSRLGANGVRLDRPPTRRGVRVWGWPAQAPYTGEQAELCRGRTTRHRSSSDAKIACAMTGGASGGPWLLRKDRKRHRGYIFAVSSRRTTGTDPHLLATPLPAAYKKLRRQANR